MAVVRVDTETGEKVERSEEFFISPKVTWRALEGCQVLTLAEERVLNTCLAYVQYGTNAVWEHGPLTIQDIGDRCHMDRANTSRCINALIHKNCLLFEKAAHASAYYVNPALARCGTKEQLASLADRFNQQRQRYVASGDESVRWNRRTIPITYGHHQSSGT